MFFKTPGIVRRFYSKATWIKPSVEKRKKTVYLTFDDGPTPEITDWVLDLLSKEEIFATFFCVGKNIEEHPNLFEKIQKDNHTVGNHTFSHLNGWKCRKQDYFADVEKCNQFLKRKIFRPPYGKMTPAQFNFLRKNYEIIFWDIITYDYKQNLNIEQSLKYIKQNTRDGSVIVFHDSVKAYSNLKQLLPLTISFLKDKGFEFSKF